MSRLWVNWYGGQIGRKPVWETIFGEQTLAVLWTCFVVQVMRTTKIEQLYFFQSIAHVRRVSPQVRLSQTTDHRPWGQPVHCWLSTHGTPCNSPSAVSWASAARAGCCRNPARRKARGPWHRTASRSCWEQPHPHRVWRAACCWLMLDMTKYMYYVPRPTVFFFFFRSGNIV